MLLSWGPFHGTSFAVPQCILKICHNLLRAVEIKMGLSMTFFYVDEGTVRKGHFCLGM